MREHVSTTLNPKFYTFYLLALRGYARSTPLISTLSLSTALRDTNPFQHSDHHLLRTYSSTKHHHRLLFPRTSESNTPLRRDWLPTTMPRKKPTLVLTTSKVRSLRSNSSVNQLIRTLGNGTTSSSQYEARRDSQLRHDECNGSRTSRYSESFHFKAKERE